MSQLFLKMMNISLYAVVLILAVILLRVLFKKAPKWISCLFWALVAIRLICPVTIESPFSLLPTADKLPTANYSMIDISDAVQVEPTSTVETISKPDSSDRQEETVVAQQDDSNYNATYLADSNNVADSISDRNTETTKKDPVKVLAIIWFAGFCIMMLQALCSFYRLKRSVAASIEVDSNIRVCDEIRYPFVFGIIRPIIYLPSFLQGNMKRFVLAHEMAHLNRHDHWWKPLGFFLLAIHWFNPLCWIAYILFCRDMEMACDERVVRGMDRESKADYSETLLILSRPVNWVTACPVAFGEIGVKQRVKGIFNYKKPSAWIVMLAIVGCVAMAACFLTSPLKTETASAEDKVEEQTASEDVEVKGDVVYNEDIDDNGQEDYIYMYQLPEVEQSDDHVIDWTMVLNGEKVASGTHALLCDFDTMCPDLDNDGKAEILVKLLPYVNSMPLEEFFVLKQVDGKWIKLQDTSNLAQKAKTVDTSNAFPISVKVGQKPGTLDIQVEEDKTITVDVTEHYLEVLESQKGNNLHDLAEGVLNQSKYSAGDDFGTVADWGIWKIEAASIDGVSCLCATEGISSIEGGKNDIIGIMDIYFNYGSDGKINILKSEFNKLNS